jgi:hypothetical protein
MRDSDDLAGTGIGAAKESTDTDPAKPRFRDAPVSRIQLTIIGPAAILAVAMAVAWLRQRFELFTVIPAAAALLSLTLSAHWWSRRRVIAWLAVLNVALIFTYLWSLDDSQHLVIRVTPSGYIASIGKDTTYLQKAAGAGSRIVLFSGPLRDYRVQPMGEAQPPGNPSALVRFAEALRLVEPKPAWTNIRLISGSSSQSLPGGRFYTLSGSWSTNARGELEGNPDSNAQIGVAPGGSYTIQADLLRGDGTQGIVLGLNSSNHGTLLAVRMDAPDMTWFDYSNGIQLTSFQGTLLHVGPVPMLQRDLRLLLGNYIAALLLIALAIPLYLVLKVLLAAAGGGNSDELNRVEHLLHPRLLDGAAVLAGCVAVAVALHVSGLLQQIPHVQDSVSNLWQAKILAMGRIWVPTPKNPQFFNEEYVAMYRGHWLSIYLPGWPFLLAVGVLLQVPWLVNPLLAGVNLLLIYLMGREVYGRRIALIATVLVLASPFYIVLAGEYMAHTATLLYLDGFALCTLLWLQGRPSTSRWRPPDAALLAAAGFLIGMAFITRQIDAAAWGLPFLGFVLLQRPHLRTLRVGLWALLGFAISLLILGLYSWNATGDPLHTPYSLGPVFNQYGFGPRIGPIGNTLGNGLWNTSLNLEMLSADLFGWPFFVTLAFACIPFLVGAANRWDTLFGVTAFAVVAVYVGYWGSGVMYGPRYYYAVITPLALLTARGFEELYRLPMRLGWTGAPDRLAALLLPTLLLALLFPYNLEAYWPTQLPLYHGYNFTSADSLDAVQNAHVHHALVFVVSNPPTQWWSYGAVFPANSPLLNSDVVYARDLGSGNKVLAAEFPGRATYRLTGSSLARIRP